VRVAHVSTVHRALDVRIFRKECRTLARAGHEVHLIVASCPAGPVDQVTFHALETAPNAGRAKRIFVRQRSALRLCRKLRADLYHLHDPELIPLGILLKLRGARVVYDVHEDTPREAWTLHREHPVRARLLSLAWLILEGVAKRVLDGFVCATPTIAANFPPERTIIAHNYPLKEEFEGRMRKRDHGSPLRLVYAGVISVVRGVREMVVAVGLLPDALGARLVLLGDFPSAELEAEVKALPGWRRVLYLGWQPRERMLAELAQSHVGLVLFHPEADHLDALPNKLFEYMAAGLAVVASDFPLWRSLLERTGAGITVNPLDPPAIAKRIAELYEEQDAVDRMGARGQSAISSDLNWEQEGRRLVALYARLSPG